MVNVGWWDLENCGHSPPSVPTTKIILLVTPRLDRCALSDLDVMVVVAHDLRIGKIKHLPGQTPLGRVGGLVVGSGEGRGSVGDRREKSLGGRVSRRC